MAGLLSTDDEERKNEVHTAEQIFAFILETATLSELELAAYCREKGLYLEQVKQCAYLHQP